MRKLDAFTRGYIECALWSSTAPWSNEQGEPRMDDHYEPDTLPDALVAEMVADCEAFQRDNTELLTEAGTDSQNGHDFWLTREGHGAGFWDRGYGDVGDKLTEAAHAYGIGSDAFYQHVLEPQHDD